MIPRTGNHVHVDHALNALVNGRTRNAALGGYVLRRNAGIAHDNLENLTI